MTFSTDDIIVPADVPKTKVLTYTKNYMKITKKSGNLMLFAGDQRVEHLNGDFVGNDIDQADGGPEHLFKIASQSKVGCFASQMGLIARYGKDYSDVDYLVKINSKSNLVSTEQKDPYSKAWYSIEDVVEFKKNSGLSIVGIGYTLYLGSEYEAEMFEEAAQLILNAHKNGLVFVLWIYPRGKAVIHEKDPHLIAGACNVASALNTDFVKVSFPETMYGDPIESFKEAIKSAGRTKVVCAGGSSTSVEGFLKTLHDQIYISGAAGNATGRNIHQKPLKEAVAFSNAISAITIDGKSVSEAMRIYHQQK
jgi:fructose-bisphosphate aldolase/6-deoxy-5-ketofructose 1-phosphate synthase